MAGAAMAGLVTITREGAKPEGKETLGERLEVRNDFPGNSDQARIAFPPESRSASVQLCTRL